jgi:hypothetical protein
MPVLVPRLQVSDETAARLRGLASERGVGVGEVIAEVLEDALSAPGRTAEDRAAETLFRVIAVGERLGLAVQGGPGSSVTFPTDWMNVGRLSAPECRRLAAGYVEWRRCQEGEGGRR